MAYIPIDDRELFRLVELVRTYEYLMSMLLDRHREDPRAILAGDPLLCETCGVHERARYKFCTACRAEANRLNVQQHRAKIKLAGKVA